MEISAFKMQLKKGYEAEYKKRHDEIWPELQALLRADGVADYYIFLDEETNILFAYMAKDAVAGSAPLSDHPLMKKWWAYMKDIMESNPDNSPVTRPLKQVFHL